MDELPKKIIRGIPNHTYIDDDGYPKYTLFYEFASNPAREIERLELSINWYDNTSALAQIFEQKKNDGEYQFKIGGVVLSKDELDRQRSRPAVQGLLSYERYKLEDNDYHGNLLLKKGLSKDKIKLIASGIALCVESVERRPEKPKQE